MTATCFVSTLCDGLRIRLAVAALAGNGHAAQSGGTAHQHAHHGSQLAGISRLGYVGLGFLQTPQASEWPRESGWPQGSEWAGEWSQR